jgi:hypothetical protein
MSDWLGARAEEVWYDEWSGWGGRRRGRARWVCAGEGGESLRRADGRMVGLLSLGAKVAIWD